VSAAKERQERCLQAISGVLEYMRRGKSADNDTAELRERFLSPAGILEGNLSELADDILTETEAQLLSCIPNLTRYARRSQFGEHPRLNSLTAASEYLKSLFIGVAVEHFHLLCLDASGQLLECIPLQEGTIDETPFYLSRVLQSVVTTDAAAVILSHNHPGGTLRPSQADLNCTTEALGALFPLQVVLLDHIIIAEQQAVSLRDHGYIRSDVWLGQAPENALLRGWLDN